MVVPIPTDAAVAVRPISSETQAPWITPARTSRPIASEPSGKPGRSPGHRNGLVARAQGSLLKSSGPKMAIAATAPNTPSPSTAARFLRYRCHRPRRGIASLQRDPRVEPCVKQVDREVNYNHKARGQQQDAEQEVDVALEDRLER